MSLTDEQEEQIRFMLSELDSDEARKMLNTWEQGFISDQVKRYDQYGSQLNLSPKQWKKINDLYEKVTG